MKKVLLSACLIALGSTISFSQQQENVENAPELRKVEVKAVKAKKVKKATKIEAAKVEVVQSDKTSRKESTEPKAKKEN